MILVTGGARSGKSSFGESLLDGIDDVLYIATSIPFDGEMNERVKIHRESRNDKWDTLEEYKDFHGKITGNYKGIIVDCITIMVSNFLLEGIESFEEEDVRKIDFREKEKEILKGIDSMVEVFNRYSEENDTKIILVTNEVGAGLVPEYKIGREFRDIAGKVNQYLAKKAQEVYLVVSGIPLKIKGE